MKNNTIFEYFDNGIAIRYEDGIGDEIFSEDDNVHESIKEAYGGIVKNTIECFDEDTLRKAIGFKVNLEITPVFDEKKLFFKKKRN